MASKQNSVTFGANIRNHFVAGLVLLTPIFLTILIVAWLVRLIDTYVVNPLFQVLPVNADASFKIALTKVTIAVLVVLFVTLLGFFAERFIFRRVLHKIEDLLLKIPLLNSVYGSIREIAQAFFGDKKGIFKKVVFLEYPRKGLWVLAFVMQDKPWEINDKTGKDIVVLFVPSPPNPATGMFVFAPREEIIDADMTVEEAIKLTISGGVAVPVKR